MPLLDVTVFNFVTAEVLCYFNVLTGETSAHVLNDEGDVSPTSP